MSCCDYWTRSIFQYWSSNAHKNEHFFLLYSLFRIGVCQIALLIAVLLILLSGRRIVLLSRRWNAASKFAILFLCACSRLTISFFVFCFDARRSLAAVVEKYFSRFVASASLNVKNISTHFFVDFDSLFVALLFVSVCARDANLCADWRLLVAVGNAR